MSNFNSCEEDHRDVEGFFAAVAQEGASLQAAKTLGTTSMIRLVLAPTIFDLAIGCIPITEQAATDQGLLYEIAPNCARSVMSGECERYQLTEDSSSTRFQLDPKGVEQ